MQPTSIQDLKTSLLLEGRKGWSSGLCACTSDWCSCLANLCCSPCTTAQLWTRYRLAGWPTCLAITLFLTIATFASSSMSESGSRNGFWMSLIGAAGSVMTLLIICTVRRSIRTRDGIEPTCYEPVDDICYSFWCGPCTTCQIMRHEKMVYGRYSLLSPTGGVPVQV
mmetsp:Transcript_21265/g.44819  ORF Transcript_21265/g.44819 Transcript_21265/m.44819 type:complete len:167 (-) Transcript_21265:1253-1753(-)